MADGFTSPVGLAVAPGDDGRLFVVDQVGLVHIVEPDGQLQPTPFLDIRSQLVALDSGYDERGMLGLVFHPDYVQNGRLFTYYSAPLRNEAPSGYDHTSTISEFHVAASDPNVAEVASERVVLEIDQPQSNHNGGQITFGPDGYLYISLGDGGDADDTGLGHGDDWYGVNDGGNGQDPSHSLLGSILRIDVDGAAPYAIPADNPFVETADVFDEIWAYGFRNPYRMSFDSSGQHDLFVADAGQNSWEEVSIVERGGNYGWNVKEGTHCFSTADPNVALDSCPEVDNRGNPLVDPVIEYLNANQDGGLGYVVVGGFAYRGSALPTLEGSYVFADWSRGFEQGDGTLLVASRPPTGNGLWPLEELSVAGRSGGRLGEFVLSLGQDRAGELYLMTTGTLGPADDSGKVYRIIPADG
ncbi:MAG: PQQ-dependent sugar dehydrogenase [Deltaproteobacteria bacterium]|nr:PQQ-dependent sugar dehydrogenase [Deltaproteobacteria bacterium]